MHTDPVADMIIRIKNGYLAKMTEVAAPWSKANENLARVLLKSGYLAKVDIKKKDDVKKDLVFALKYDGKQAALTEVKRVSRPSLRVYANKRNLPRVLGGLGIAVISTPKGMMTDREARKQGLGGEVWCEIW